MSSATSTVDRSVAHLDPIFKPRWHRYSAAEIEHIVAITPLDELPATLDPPPVRSRRAPMPPVMLYGWVINQDHWFEYAKEHGHSVTMKVISYEGENDPNFELDEDAEELPPRVIIPTVDEHRSVCCALWTIMHNLGIKPVDYYPVKATLASEEFDRLVVLTDNYHDDDSLTEENLEKLQKILGCDDVPKWYPYTYFEWDRDCDQ
ncbi:hypothetical protein PHLCEN_2v4895 [Hermanssonia centrifuga]|uniref:Uncharacterized protein n=1 Tax=Hermanssonia centrifuga TaxID=98765 RepID=A0A2R6PFZ6_9APHY|nr:hypothetical protein PHLCEN_2v4895 [Hermanssonia centrifuga]